MMSKKTSVLTILLSLVLVGILSGPASLQVFAQDSTENLLQNPGFEGNFVPVGGDELVQVGEGWLPWNLPPGQGVDSDRINVAPEYQPAPATRVLSGDNAQQYDTFFATHVGGIFQSVTLSEPGTLTFTANVYPYSSASFEDINTSVDPQGLEISVGIDPSGGTDGNSPNIIWFTASEYYDEFQELSVTTTSTGTTVTVWIRSSIDPPGGLVGLHQVFIDDTALVFGEGDGTPTDTPTDEPTDEPTDTPTDEPTDEPTEEPTEEATDEPTEVPTDEPTEVPTDEPTEDPTEEPTAVAREPYSEQLPNEQPYVVEQGDTVGTIALQFNSEAEAIIEYNSLSESGLIFVGQTLLIPVPANQGQPVIPTETAAPGGGQGQGQDPNAQLPPPGGIYVVQPGDNLFRIALRYGLTTDTLARFNGIINPARIQVGQQIRIPPAAVPGTGGPAPAVPVTAVPATGAAPPFSNFIIHVVQPGENAFRIGLRYNLTWDILAAANGLINPNYIVVGQELIIPRY